MKYKKSKIAKNIELFILKFFIAGRFNEKSVVTLTSSPRSGSTWLGNVLGSIQNSCMLFEPLQLNFVPEARTAGFSWRTYVQPGNQWPEGEAYLRRVFEGRVINDWTAREISLYKAVRAKLMIVKFVRANRLLPWMANTFKFNLSILLIRHPCAVIASQLKSTDWNTAERPGEPLYLAEYPQFKSALANTKGVEEYLAANWALDQLPPLLEKKPWPWIIITYEELFLYPKNALSNIFQIYNMKLDIDKVKEKLIDPSSTAYNAISGIYGWKKQLTSSQEKRIIDTIKKFGINFYSQNIEPDFDILNSQRLSESIRVAGL